MSYSEKMAFWKKRAEEMEKMRQEGNSYAKIASKFGVHRQRVYQILKKIEKV